MIVTAVPIALLFLARVLPRRRQPAARPVRARPAVQGETA